MHRLRAILALAAPTALVSLIQVAGQLFETWLAARQGTVALAGWAAVLPFALLMQMMSAGAMGGGVVSAFARALGGRRSDEAAALVIHAALIALAAGLLFAVPLALFPRTVLGWVAGEAVANAAAPYAIWLFGAAALPVWLANTLASVLRGGG
jgi:Na+-driven multidrug efflux pump